MNTVTKVTKQVDGSLLVEFHTGHLVTIAASDPLFQTFVVYVILHDL